MFLLTKMSEADCAPIFTPKKRKLAENSTPTVCYVCPNNSKRRRDISFHSFPEKGKDFIFVDDPTTGTKVRKDRLTLWCDFANISENNCKKKKLCSVHFDQSDFMNPSVLDRSCRRLKRIAVPHRATISQGLEQTLSVIDDESCAADDVLMYTMSGEKMEEGTRFAPKKRKVIPGSGGRNCYVCRRNDQFNRDLTFHSFPIKGKTFVLVKDEVSGVLQKKDRLTLWCEFANISEEARSKTLSLCSLHFKRQDYFPGGQDKMFRCLKKNAVPSIFNVWGKGCEAQLNVNNVESQPTTHKAELNHEMTSNEEVPTTSGTSHPKMSQEQDSCESSHLFEHVVVKQEPITDLDSCIQDPLNEFEQVVVKQEPIDLDPCNNDSMILNEFEHVDVKQEPLDAGNITPNARQEQVDESLPQFEHISVKEESIGSIEFIETDNTEQESFGINQNDTQENPLITLDFDSHLRKESAISFA
ncbi:hypothetical protein B566_EDAN012609 [Ephemera danica]|nr:hypothetical protein B566_EDAN012609 [Ephemera danica]